LNSSQGRLVRCLGLKAFTEEQQMFCECGCGNRVTKSKNRFIHGHHIKVNNPMKRPEIAVKFSGDQNPMKRPEVIAKAVAANRGMKRSLEGIENMSVAQKKRYEDPEQIRLLSIARKKLWQIPDYQIAQKMARNMSPNKSEILLGTILEKLFPDQFNFVGDYSLFIGGKCPDFVHVSKHLVIELFGDYWHGEERTSTSNEQHVQERIDHFARYGYEAVVVWEHELEDLNKLKKKLNG
jgi:very-short-patch-repair endonuclease